MNEKKKSKTGHNRNSVNHDDEHYEEFLHPNMRVSVAKNIEVKPL